jgi:hypothetical protein
MPHEGDEFSPSLARKYGGVHSSENYYNENAPSLVFSTSLPYV